MYVQIFLKLSHFEVLRGIVVPWGKYEYLNVPMGLCNSPDLFQEKMNKLFSGLEYVGTYIDDLLINSKKSFEDDINKLDKVIS